MERVNVDCEDDFLISTQGLPLVKNVSLGQSHFVVQAIVNSPHHYRKKRGSPSSGPPLSSSPLSSFSPPAFYRVRALFIQIYLASVKPFYASIFLLHGIKINKARRNSPILLKSPRSFCFQSLNKSSSNELGLKVNCVCSKGWKGQDIETQHR